MLSIIFGTILIAVGVAAFWHLLPRHGKEHPFVENTNVGSSHNFNHVLSNDWRGPIFQRIWRVGVT